MGKKPAVKKKGGFGKKGVGKKLDEGVGTLELKPLGDRTPRLPISVYAVIAEHLIGQLAFGTTASLNAVSRAVHEETLPILYESFFMEEYEATIPEESRGVYLPDAVRHTKYLFYTTDHEEDAQAFQKLDQFTNIVMSICVNVDEAGVCHIRLYRPVSTATAVAIIETPIRQDNMGDAASDHHWCIQSLHLVSLMHMTGLLGNDELEYMFGEDIPMPEECLAQQGKPAVRPVSNIRKVILVKGAYLHDHPPIRLPSIKTNLRLHNLEIRARRSVPYQDIERTTLELMKLAAVQANAKNLVDAERKLVPEHGFGIASLGPPKCMLRLEYEEWHIKLVMSMSGAEQFVKQLRVDAEARPKMLLNRLHLTITGDVAQNDFHKLLAELHGLYSSKITGMHLVLPTRSDPPEVACCQVTDKKGQVKWSGTVQVVPRKRGVSVKLKVDMGDASHGQGSGAFIEEIEEV